MVTRTYPPDSGAAPIRLGALAAALGAAGADVRVLTTRPAAGSSAADGAPDGTGAPHPPDVRRWPVLRDAAGRVRGYLPYASFDLPLSLRLACTPRPDVVVVEPPPTTGAVVRLVAALREVPYAYYAADVMSTAAAGAGVGGPALAVLRALEGFALRGAAAVLTPSPGMADHLVALGARPQRVAVVGTGTDTDAFTPGPLGAPGRAAGPGPTGAPDADAPRGAPPVGTPLAVYAGTMSEVHGTEVLVRAFARAARRVPDAHLALVGDGTERAALAALAHRLAPGRVTVTGQVPVAEVARWWRRASVGLAAMPHYPVAHATKMFAATACGTPVVYAGPGPCAAMVIEGDLGWTVPWDVDAVADALVQALTHPPDAARRERLAAWTREHASLTTVAARAAAAVLAARGAAAPADEGAAAPRGAGTTSASAAGAPAPAPAPRRPAPSGPPRPPAPPVSGRTRFVLSATQPLRGMERAAAEVVGRLRAGGLDAEIAVLDPGPPARTRAERVRRLARSAAAARALVHEAHRDGDTLVLVGLWVALRALPWAGGRGRIGGAEDGSHAGPRRGARIVGWEHSYTRERAARSRSFAAVARIVLPLYAARADAVVAVSPAVADALPAALEGRTAVIANPVAAEPAAPGQRTDRPAGAPLRLLALGGLVPVKAPHLLLDALEALRARDVPAHLDVAGSGPLLAGLRQRALDADLDVTWHGHVADVAPLLAGADALVHTAVSETFGYALLEAAAAGVPVVAAATAQTRHLVPHLVPGLVCAPTGDALALAVCAAVERPSRQREAEVDAAWRARREAFDPAALERGWRAVLGAPAPDLS